MIRVLVLAGAMALAGCTTLPPANTPGAPIKLDEETVTRVQRLLNERGFDAGPVDGVFGQRTETALRQFEQSRGLPADGILDSTSYAYLSQKPVLGGDSGGGSTDIDETLSGLFGGAVQAAGTQSSPSGGSSTTGRGAAMGAAIGGAAGYLGGGAKTAVIGAVAGALIGNFIEHQRVRTSQQVYEQYGSGARVVLNNIQLSREIIRPGEEGQATVNYDVIAPDPQRSQSITHTMDYYQGDTKLASNSQSLDVTPGGYETIFPVAVPEGAEEGEYRLVARVQSPEGQDRKERSFQVIYALNEDGAPRVVSRSYY